MYSARFAQPLYDAQVSKRTHYPQPRPPTVIYNPPRGEFVRSERLPHSMLAWAKLYLVHVDFIFLDELRDQIIEGARRNMVDMRVREHHQLASERALSELTPLAEKLLFEGQDVFPDKEATGALKQLHVVARIEALHKAKILLCAVYADNIERPTMGKNRIDSHSKPCNASPDLFLFMRVLLQHRQ